MKCCSEFLNSMLFPYLISFQHELSLLFANFYPFQKKKPWLYVATFEMHFEWLYALRKQPTWIWPNRIYVVVKVCLSIQHRPDQCLQKNIYTIPPSFHEESASVVHKKGDGFLWMDIVCSSHHFYWSIDTHLWCCNEVRMNNAKLVTLKIL